MNNGDNSIARSVAESQARAAAAEAFYAMLHNRRQLDSHRVLTYRCPRRCLLADVLRTRQGVLIHFPRYKFSPDENERASTPAGRAANTEDGDRRWRGHTIIIDAEPSSRFLLNCDHVLDRPVETGEFLAAIERGTPDVVIT